MEETLSTTIASWRAANQTNSILEKLKIGQDLYDVKDPAVEALASAVETRLSAVENKTWTAVTKGQNEGRVATSVEQGTDGSITVTYGNVLANAVTDTAVTGQFVTKVDQAVDGTVSVTRGTVDAANVTFSETGWDAATAKAAILEALTKAIGTTSDISSADTINAAKKYADEAIAALAGQDWAQNAKTVKQLIEEIENSENGNSWLTAIDKLAGMSINKTGASAADAVEYNGKLTGAIQGGSTLTAEQATAVNAVVSGANYSEGQTISDADATAYNATLQGAIAAGENTQWTDTNVTVKEYVDAKFAEAQAAASGGITDLDAVVRGNLDSNDAVTSGHKVGVKVTEVDGVITNVTVVEDDIASAQDLEDLTDTVEEHSEVTAAALTDLNSRLGSIETNLGNTDLTTALAAKANKAAITTGNINNWTTSYNSSNHQLEWTNTQTSVYVPVSGQSL